MDTETTRLIGVVFACIGLVATVVHYVFKAKEIRALKDIAERLRK
jgi:hypothetical protein